MGMGAVTAAIAIGVFALVGPQGQHLTQRDIDLAVLHTLKRQPKPPSHAAVAYEVIRPSVVRVRQFAIVDDEAETKADGKDTKPNPGKDAGKDKAKKAKEKEHPRPVADTQTTKKAGKEVEVATGTGVVIVDSGIILTSLHVVAGASHVGVVFADGSESDAEIINTQPWNDMAVLQAKTVPDDLPAATLRSTRGLKPGDEVMAVGFPFGLGPSLSAGVVSGLKREFESPEGKVRLRNLIQFDTAANPGNSGGPLVTEDGAVVGIVTAILNPKDRVFIGIGFAVPIENAAAAVGPNPF
jgi:S1-C subfamily serine protease